MNEIEKIIVNKTQGTITFEKILEFLETNQEIIIKEKRAAIPLNSLATKVRPLVGHEPLVAKLRSYVKFLIPSDSKQIKDFMQLMKNTIFDPSEHLQAMTDWIDLVKMPLAQIELTEIDFYRLAISLEDPDLTDFNFQLMNSERLARILLTQDIKFITKNITFLTTLAKLCAHHDAYKTACRIGYFAIEDEEARAEIAKICAQKSGRFTAEYIQNFAIGKESTKVEIAKLCAQQNGGFTAYYIKNFAIWNESARGEIANLCAQQNGEWTVCNIENFFIGHEPTKIAIAEICAQKAGRYTAQFVQNFALGDESAKIEIAKLCAHQDGQGTSQYITNFAIEDESARADIARLCAQQSGFTAEYVRNFDIKDELIRVEVAKLCAKQNAAATLRNFRNFDIKNDLARVEIAELCAKQDGEGTALFIQRLGIRDEKARAEIAKLCAQQNGQVTSQHITDFDIEDEGGRIEIAKLCAQQNGARTAVFIERFDIGEEKARVEIAKLCAQQNGGGTARNIGNFGIKDEAARVEIGKLCAQHNGSKTAEYIHHFKLRNSHSFYELFLDCVEADPQSLFHIPRSSHPVYELYLDCIEVDPQSLFHIPTGLMKISLMIDILKLETPEDSHRRELFKGICHFIDKLPVSKDNQKIILDMNRKIQALPSRVQNAVVLWLFSSLLSMRRMKMHVIKWLLESGIWSELGLLKDPGLRVSLSSGLRVLSVEGARTKLWGAFTSNVRGIEGQRGLMLLAIPFINLKLQGIEECKLIAVGNHLSALQRKKKSSFRNVHQVKNLLHTIHSLASSNQLTAEQKKRGFEKIFFDQSMSPNTLIHDEQQILKNVIAAKGLLQLKDTQWPNAIENLNVLFRLSFEKLIPLEKYVEDASTKYEEIFAKCRNPSGLLTYAAGLKTLGEPALLSSLGQYVVWVMDKTFKNNRYDTRDNPHLSKVLEGNPELLSVWKEEIQTDVDTLISGNKKEETFDSEKWLHTKLIVDKHLGGSNLPYLIKYFKEPSAEARKEIFSALSKEIKELLSTLSTSRATDPILTNLNLQKACMKFAKEGKIADKKTLIKNLEEIDKALHQEAKPPISLNASEFAQDVKGLLEALRKETVNNAQKKGDLQVVFTDDPIDLLLCGTDVSGSCQRLDGDPNFNKGLLGYLIDGKNRLLAIKDGNKIMARCILRLLWDGKQPVVYRERFYPDQISSAEKEALNGLAKLIAQKLAVPLTCGEGDVPYNHTLQALGGPASYEYCDGAGSLQKEGRYTIYASILE